MIRDSGNVIGLERIAVMAALNLNYELLQATGSLAPQDDETLNRIAEKLENALATSS